MPSFDVRSFNAQRGSLVVVAVAAAVVLCSIGVETARVDPSLRMHDINAPS
jgi:hypothetical protein